MRIMTNQTENPPIAGQESHPSKPGTDHPFKVTIRTLAGHTHLENVKPSELVRNVTDKAVNFFVSKGELLAGQYSLTLPRSGGNAELDPTASLHDVGVVEGDILVLVSRSPQIDG